MDPHLRHLRAPHQNWQSERMLEDSEVKKLIRKQEKQMEDIYESQQQLQRVFASQKAKLDFSRERVQQLEAEKAELQLERLRPVTGFDITDETISHELNTFHRSLASWTHALPNIQKSSSNNLSVRQYLRRNGSPNSTLTLSSGDEVHLETELAAAGISSLIMNGMFLQHLFGIPLDERLIFEKLQKGIARMKGESSETIETCQKELIRIWSKCPSYENDRDKACDKLAQVIKNHLSGWGYPMYNLNDSLQHLQAQSLRPAAQLVTKIACSYEKYFWDVKTVLPSRIQKSLLTQFEMLDFGTHCEIPPSRVTDLPDDAVIGEYVMTIFPPFYREDVRNNTKVLVAKGWCVVKPCPQETNTKKPYQRMDHVEIKQEAQSDIDIVVDVLMGTDKENNQSGESRDGRKQSFGSRASCWLLS